MDLVTLLIIVSCLIIIAVVMYFVITAQLTKLKTDLANKTDPMLIEWIRDMKTSTEKTREEMQRQLHEQRGSIDNQLKNQNDVLNQQLKNQSQVMFNQTKLITERLEGAQSVIGKIQTQLGGITEFGKDMKDLSNVLKSPKLRGGLGEQFLYEILSAYLPADLFQTQYKFKDGDVCDAVVFTDKGIIPIDSKFPLENFKLMLTADTDELREKAKKVFESDVKKRVDEIAKKYLLPAEGTTDQAIMYVPSENVFYEIIVNSPQIEEYAKKKNIILVSPNTLSYFVKVILVAYQQHELEKNATEILKSLSGIKIEAEKFGEEMGVLERHISNSYKSMDNVKTRYQKLYTKIETVQALDGSTVEEQKPLLS